MEPANTTVVYTIETSIAAVKKIHGSWFVFIEDLWISVDLGEERPKLNVGDRIAVQIKRIQDAKDIGTSIEQSSQASALG